MKYINNKVSWIYYFLDIDIDFSLFKFDYFKVKNN